MDLDRIRNFNRSEKVALLKLIIKVAAADNKITKDEKELIKTFLKVSQLRISNEYIKEVVGESYDDIVSVFTNKLNLNRAFEIAKDFAKSNKINPAYEGKALDNIKLAVEDKKKTLKFSLSKTVKIFFLEFAFLWGKEDLNPAMKLALAMTFTILACVIGSIWTYDGAFAKIASKFSYGLSKTLFGDLGSKTDFVSLQGSHVVCGILILGALCFRKYLPSPVNFRSILFSVANLYLLSTLAMHLIGRTGFEKRNDTFHIFRPNTASVAGHERTLWFFLYGFFHYVNMENSRYRCTNGLESLSVYDICIHGH